MKFDDFSKVERLTATESSDYIKTPHRRGILFRRCRRCRLVDTANTVDCVIVPIDVQTADALIKKYPSSPKPLFQGRLQGHEQDVPTVAVMAILVPELKWKRHAYQITKAIFENLADIERAHAKGKELKLETALNGMSIPLHPAPRNSTRKKAS